MKVVAKGGEVVCRSHQWALKKCKRCRGRSLGRTLGIEIKGLKCSLRQSFRHPTCPPTHHRLGRMGFFTFFSAYRPFPFNFNCSCGPTSARLLVLHRFRHFDFHVSGTRRDLGTPQSALRSVTTLSVRRFCAIAMLTSPMLLFTVGLTDTVDLTSLAQISLEWSIWLPFHHGQQFQP